MADVVTEGCKTCPNCGKDAGAFLEGDVPFWRCKNGHVTSGALLRPPSKCSSCTETDLDVRAWHMKDCVCLECGKSYSPVTGVFEQPEWLKEALERIAEATIRKRG